MMVSNFTYSGGSQEDNTITSLQRTSRAPNVHVNTF